MSNTATAPEAPTAPAPAPEPLFNALDRCDGCGARAYAKVIIDIDIQTKAETDLKFCSHHWNKHKDAVLPKALAHHDETHLLIEAEQARNKGGSTTAFA